MIICCRHGQHGERGTVSVSGQDQPAGLYAEYFEADDKKDLIKKEAEDDTEDNGPGTFNSETSNWERRETLKLRL